MPRKFQLLDLAGVFTVGAVAVICYITIDAVAARWTSVALNLGFAALLLFHPSTPEGEAPNMRVAALYFGGQTLLVVGLLLLGPNAFAGPLLFFILSAEVMMTLATRPALAWIGLFVAITFLAAILAQGFWSGALFTLPYAGGFLFFGTFGKALRDAETARQESQRLLDELRAAQQRLQDLAVVEERNRVARELHDSLGHRLTVAIVQLEGAQRLIPTDPERAARMTSSMREQMKEALADLRHSVATLRAPLSDDLPLDAALTRLAHSFQESTGLTVHLRLPAPLPPLTDAQRLALFRAAQEALTNVQRHAAAQTVWLTLASVDHQHLALTAADDGRGYRSPSASGFGLRGLRERAAELGGELSLETRPGGGAQLCLTLPLAPQAEPSAPPTATPA